MQTQIQPYLFFEGRTEEALEFYRQALGARTVFSMKYGEGPEKSTMPPGKVMHASFTVGSSMLMALRPTSSFPASACWVNPGVWKMLASTS